MFALRQNSDHVAYKYTHSRNSSGYRGEVERRLPLLVLHGGVGSVRQQQGTQLGASLLCSLVERSERPLIRGIHTRVVLDQQSRNIHMLRKNTGLCYNLTTSRHKPPSLVSLYTIRTEVAHSP